MEDVSVVWVLVGMGVLVLGPAGAVWADIRRQVHTVVKQWDDTQEWLKEVQIQTNTNTTDLAVLAAIVKDRAEREIS